MRSHPRQTNRPAIWLTVLGIMTVTVIAKTQMPAPAAARAVVTAPLTPKELAARGLIRELSSALISADENAYLALWYFEGEGGPRRKARVIEQFRERPDRRQEVARGLLAALVQPDALRVTGVDESMATFDYAYRNFRRDRTERVTLITIDGVWRITRVF